MPYSSRISHFPNDYGIGKIDGYTVFVPGGIPGDRIKVEITYPGKRFGYGRIVSFDEQSTCRTAPFCPHFGTCGGCTLQNVPYSEQLAMKENYLHQTLRRIGKIDSQRISILPIAASPETKYYRGKIELAFGDDGDKIRMGLRKRVLPHEKYTGSIVPIIECPVFSGRIKEIISALSEYAAAGHFAAYNPVTGTGFLKHCIVRESKTTGELMCIIETAPADLSESGNCPRFLVDRVSDITSMYSTENSSMDDVIHFEKTIHRAGKKFIEENFAPATFHIYPQSFFQPNPFAARKLYDFIPEFEEFGSDDVLYGLYCGTGTIEIMLSRFVKHVTGVDSLSENINNAIENCRINQVGNCSFKVLKAENIRKARKQDSPSVVLIDPPRTGLSKQALDNIVGLKPKRVIYISCNPATLARDLAVLQNQRYMVRRVAPFDFFPHTSHLETLVSLHRH
ncbi:MAG TPA: 23S rRNA (uracil(1939)-C(5))-methyltransferase RlmD [Syntrophorhabdaceae bacterium]|nr:23S rRNA (uracil(1939)-C(5))-methyltransferase RlmD [Syntrophorhabdaceae bacterium]